jgi:hypothetical protein
MSYNREIQRVYLCTRNRERFTYRSALPGAQSVENELRREVAKRAGQPYRTVGASQIARRRCALNGSAHGPFVPSADLSNQPDGESETPANTGRRTRRGIPDCLPGTNDGRANSVPTNPPCCLSV